MKRKKKNKKKKIGFPSVDTVLNKKRIITVFGEIDEVLTSRVIKELLKLDYISDNPITLLINSCGGGCTDAMAIIDAMRGCRSPIHTLIVGEACSMAGIVSVAGDKRAITENSFWMAHPLSGGTYDYKQHTYDYIEFMKVLDLKMENILRSRTNLSIEDAKKYTNGQLWLDANGTLLKGVVDEILGAKELKVRFPVKRIRRKRKNVK